MFPGDYQLSLALDFFEEGEPDRSMDVLDGPLVVIDPAEAEPEVRRLGALPHSTLARLHLFFNTNKAFLLPTALPSVRKLRKLYRDNTPGKVLVVGHCDTTADPSYNDKLSLERAEATIAFLKDDADAWLSFYDSGVDAQKRWGKVEDHLMIIALPDFVSKPKGEEPVHFYQRTRGLTVDGVAGKDTRKALVAEYMSLDGASLSDFVGEIDAVAHGCGGNFPLDDSGEQLDQAPADDKRDPIDRRVELFFFDADFGITPPPPGENSAAGSPEYPLWRKRVVETVELRADDLDGPKVTFVEMADAHFRTNSAVVLPEGEAPSQSNDHRAFTSIGVIATALRFNDEHPGRTMLIAGHTDTAADTAFNQPLSEERARVCLALLKGGADSRADFSSLCDGRHTQADIKQILSWVSGAFPNLSFACKPGPIDENPVSASVVHNFQRDFNTNKAALGSSAADLNPDGSFGPLTWGAIFDCYEFALQQELGETPAAVQALRDKLAFADPAHPSLGFGEHFPIEELGVDNFRSQTNRRVELLFFEPGEEPDVGHAAVDPETSDLYLPGGYERTPLEPMLSVKPWFADFDVASASMHQSRQLVVSAADLPVGVPLSFEVRVVGAGPVGTVAGVSSTGTASVPFEDWDAPENVPFVGDLAAGQPFPVVLFEFQVTGGGRSVTSKTPLVYADAMNMQLVLDNTQPLPLEPYVINTLWGRRNGTTDQQGLVIEQGLPPGGVSLALRDRFLVGADTLPFGWDRDNT